MALRTARTYVIPGKGVVDTRKKTYSGKGKAPAGARKIKAPTAATTPTVTTSPGGKITSSGFSSPRAARAARKQASSSQRRVRRIERLQASALGFHRRTQQRASERLPQPSTAASRKRDAPMTTKTVVSSQSLGSAVSRMAHERLPSYKPPKLTRKPLANASSQKPARFQGAKTAGAPSLKELQVASSSGKLRTNRKGYVTTPAVRKVSGTLKRLESKAGKVSGPLPGLTAQQSKVARTVLRRGVKAGARRKDLLSAAETGLVEAPNFENPAGGDLDSEGWRQERTSIYGTGPTGPRNVKASADRFFEEIRTDPGAATAPTAGMAAQAAQGSAFPERYDAVKPQANAIVKAFERGGLKPAQQRKLIAAQAKAQKLGLKVSNQRNLGPAPKKVVTRFKAIQASAKALEKMDVPYVYGGGHGSGTPDPSGGLDCSSSTVYLLNKAGVKVPNITSGSFGDYLPSGPGAVTVFYNDDHVFLRIGKRYYGTSVGDSGAGGLGYHPAPSASYLAQYNVAHVPGLGKKQALQLGIDSFTSTSFPGMTLSASGTTATVDPSATATRDKPGFSKSPIRLTQAQKAHRTLKKLAQVGAGLSESPPEGEDKGAILKALEKTYGAKAA